VNLWHGRRTYRSQADDRAYVINADVEDVEMSVETDEEEEEFVLDELGGEC
jgi:hypothetical protein